MNYEECKIFCGTSVCQTHLCIFIFMEGKLNDLDLGKPPKSCVQKSSKVGKFSNMNLYFMKIFLNECMVLMFFFSPKRNRPLYHCNLNKQNLIFTYLLSFKKRSFYHIQKSLKMIDSLSNGTSGSGLTFHFYGF